MPNVPPGGVWARRNALTTLGPGSALSEFYAAIPGNPTPRQGEEVWVAGANGVPQLVWSRSAGSPASATAVYQTSPDTQVTISWVPASPAIADTYRVYRPDGSLVGSVAAPATSLVDLNPRPLNGSYSVRGVLGGVEGPATVANSLDLRLQPATFSTVLQSPGTNGQSVLMTWTHNAVGRPDSYNVYRYDAPSWTLLTNVTGTASSFTDPTPPAGRADTLYSLNPVLSGTEGTARQSSLNVNAKPTSNEILTATNPPISTLRLTHWGPSSGECSYYEYERYEASTGPWTAHGTNACDNGTKDWSTTVAGYMRVRTVAPGGASEWHQVGPVTPINDVTPPANALISSYRPEASYGRLVLRFTCPADADFAQYLVQYSTDGSSFSNVTGWTNAAPSSAQAVVIGTFSAGQTVWARVLVRDNATPTPNQRVGSAVSYSLAATPYYLDPSGDVSGTWRGSGWRNDATRSTLEIATGGTGSGQNCGCFFYDTAAAATFFANRTAVSADIQYWRENEGGLYAAVQPQFWTHNVPDRSSGTPISSLANAALGNGVARTGTTAAITNLTAGQMNALVTNAAKGIAMYRTGGSGDPDNFYMLWPQGGAVGGSPGPYVNGRIRINHLG